MNATRALGWTERALLLVGILTAAWIIAVVVETRFTRDLPPPTRSATLPADGASRRGEVTVTSTLPRGSWVARLEAPGLHLATTVLEGSDDDTLRTAAGHIEDTAFPGEGGNIGIAGHRDTIFRQVRRMRIGEALTLTTGDRIYHYRVTNTSIVNPEDVYVLDPTEHPTMTLVTCYPFEFLGHAPKRYIVRADLVSEDTRAETAGR